MSQPASGNGKVAIVTGTASGIGTALAEDLVQQGYRVGCLDINEAAGSKLAAELGDDAIFIKCDVAKYDELAQAYQTIFSKWGRLDTCLFNAGIVDRSSVYILNHRNSKEIPPAPDVSCTQVDYFSIIYGTQLAIHFMRQNPVPGGTIVATASIGAIHPNQSFPEYCGAKAAVMQFCRTSAPILKIKDNITINVVLPGIVATPLVPKVMVETVYPDCVAPISSVVAAYNVFLKDPNRNGQVMECSADKHFLQPDPIMMNGYKTKRVCTVYDPLFKHMHGESSGMPDAIVADQDS